jgi:hypothetical protein
MDALELPRTNSARPQSIGSGHHLLQLRKCSENRLFRKGHLTRFLATSNGLAFTPSFPRTTNRHCRCRSAPCAFPDDFVLVGNMRSVGAAGQLSAAADDEGNSRGSGTRYWRFAPIRESVSILYRSSTVNSHSEARRARRLLI